jgi:iron complex transport system ATP-binding protein
MNDFCLETRDLAIGFHSRSPHPPLAGGLNLGLRPGRMTCLIGPNGVGKSTLLRTLAGLQKPVSGQVEILGRTLANMPLEDTSRLISIVLTGPLHPGDLLVEQVVGLGRLPYTNWLGTLSDEDHRLVRRALDQVGALPLAGRNFGELSDGERQKVMTARALAQDTAVIILDEPTAFLDWPNRVDLLETLKRLAGQEGKGILVSSHDLELVLRIADELWMMTEGKVLSGSCREFIQNGDLERVFAGRAARFQLSHAGIVFP